MSIASIIASIGLVCSMQVGTMTAAAPTTAESGRGCNAIMHWLGLCLV
ncbi:hypothetical protein [Bifidobacterium choerinum]|uniref:Uncharacterized protein n=1 Tax=Bifidobacterium choerinum TaxID=35760 RepID=A0A087AF20_9BIFI|nr:hypothetical protein [Bifidobacterium choerinum]KFI57370.1 hypothetical protein BCHO_0788 [Bifidobacterium choerinum]